MGKNVFSFETPPTKLVEKSVDPGAHARATFYIRDKNSTLSPAKPGPEFTVKGNGFPHFTET